MRRRGKLILLGAVLCFGALASMLASNRLSPSVISTPLSRALDLATIEDAPAADNTGEYGNTNPYHIRVEGTSIDLDLARATQATGNAFYLTHSVDGKKSAAGCPFIDWRCQDDSRNLIVYGHSFGMGHEGFTELRNAWKQTVFEALGDAVITIDGKARGYHPLFAMRVDKGYRDIQRFSFSDEAEFDTWLQQLGENASARRSHSNEHISHTLTLITCSSVRPGQRERTLVVFGNLE